MIAWLRRLFTRQPKCAWVFVSGHPLLSQCPNCRRYADEHEWARSGDVFTDVVPGVDWLTPMLGGKS